MSEKYGLVLEGGGARGSYHIGSYIALNELGYKFDAVCGTSIGAINGAFIVSEEIDKCKDIWVSKSLAETLSEENSFKMPELTDDMDLFTKIKELGKVMFNGTIPVEPLKNLVYGSLSEEKIRKSDIKFGLVTINVTDKKIEEVFDDDINEGELLDYIIASSYLPVFKMQTINGKYYLDGGFYNNIPYNMVQKLNLTPIIVRVNPNDHHDLSFPRNSIVIEPMTKINSTLNFNPKKATELIKLGYYDTIKTIKKLPGNEYYFNEITEADALKIFEEKLFENFKVNISEYKNNSPYRILIEEYCSKIANDLNLDSDYTLIDIITALIEKNLSKNNYDKFKFYDLITISKQMSTDDFYTENYNKGFLKRLISN